MGEIDIHPFWIIGFVVVALSCIVLMLLRNKAAKTDRVNRSEVDTIVESVSVTPEKSKKIDN
jgi:hypothetical protein